MMSELSMTIPAEFRPLFFFLKDPNHPDYRYYDFSGGRSSAKSTTVARALALEGAMYPTLILCAREYQNSIKDSVKRLLESVIEQYEIPGYESTVDTIRNINGTEFNFRGLHNNVEATLKSYEGAKRCWVEEAQTISEESLDILLPTIRAEGSTIIFTRNPLTPEDVITRKFVSEPTPLVAKRTYHKHVTWRIMERCGILPAEVKAQVEEAKGTPEFDHIWEGLPYDKTINQIMSWQTLNRATQRKPDTDGAVSFGVDVARYGNDRTAVAVKQGRHLADLISWQHTSITESAAKIEELANCYHPTTINVDDTGVGGGLTDSLKTHRYPVSGINFGGRAKRPDLYPNVSSELWFDFASQANTMTINPNLPHRPELFMELTTREWSINERNQRVVQSKAHFKAQNRALGSPDLADAVLLAYYQPLKLPRWDVGV